MIHPLPQAVTGHFLHGTVDDPSSLPALPDNLGLVPGKRWSELKAELSSEYNAFSSLSIR